MPTKQKEVGRGQRILLQSFHEFCFNNFIVVSFFPKSLTFQIQLYIYIEVEAYTCKYKRIHSNTSQIQAYTFNYKSNTSLYIQLQVKYKLIHSNTSQIQAYTFKYKLIHSNTSLNILMQVKYKLIHSNTSQIQAYTFKLKRIKVEPVIANSKLLS